MKLLPSWSAAGQGGAEPALPFPWPGSDSCGMHVLTGLWCPLCGGTRATLSALRGDWAAAIGWNPFALVVDAVIIVVVVRLLARWWRGRGGPIMSAAEGTALGVVACVFFIARNTPMFQPVLASLLGPPGYGA